MTVGQFDPAMTLKQNARSNLMPLSLIINADFSWLYLCSRRYDEAEAQARKDPGNRSALRCGALLPWGSSFNSKGELTNAIAEYQKAFDLTNDPFPLATLGQACARQRTKRTRARKILGGLSEQGKSRYVAPYAMALVLDALGEKAQAIDELDRGYARAESLTCLSSK